MSCRKAPSARSNSSSSRIAARRPSRSESSSVCPCVETACAAASSRTSSSSPLIVTVQFFSLGRHPAVDRLPGHRSLLRARDEAPGGDRVQEADRGWSGSVGPGLHRHTEGRVAPEVVRAVLTGRPDEELAASQRGNRAACWPSTHPGEGRCGMTEPRSGRFLMAVIDAGAPFPRHSGWPRSWSAAGTPSTSSQIPRRRSLRGPPGAVSARGSQRRASARSPNRPR